MKGNRKLLISVLTFLVASTIATSSASAFFNVSSYNESTNDSKITELLKQKFGVSSAQADSNSITRTSEELPVLIWNSIDIDESKVEFVKQVDIVFLLSLPVLI